jgi:hypothetical protein
MTYNFDPDRWYDMAYAALTARFESSELDATAFESAVADLDHRHEEMWHRLDRTYQLPPVDSAGAEANLQESASRKSTIPRDANG